MPRAAQSYRNHARYLPLYHFVAAPIVTFYFVHTLVHALRDPSAPHFLEALFALGIAATAYSARLMALTVQNRVVRLEMRLRLREILPGHLAARIPELKVRQLIALRFASDAEMPALVERVLNGEFARPRDIKRAVTDWQPDYLRA
jgi:hypothetical protein